MEMLTKDIAVLLNGDINKGHSCPSRQSFVIAQSPVTPWLEIESSYLDIHF